MIEFALRMSPLIFANTRCHILLLECSNVMVVGGTDARYYRYRGRVAYGAGLFSPGMLLSVPLLALVLRNIF